MQINQHSLGIVTKPVETAVAILVPLDGTEGLREPLGRRYEDCWNAVRAYISQFVWSERKFQAIVAHAFKSIRISRLRSVARAERGETLIEYALVCCVFCFALLGVAGLSENTAVSFEEVSTAIYFANEGGGTEGIIMCPPGVPGFVCRDRSGGGSGRPGTDGGDD